jgi:hypothetical protein
LFLILIEKKVCGVATAHGEGKNITLQGIMLSGRQLRDQLIAEPNAKRFPARLKGLGLLAFGWIGGFLTTAIKAVIEHLLK